MGYRDLVSVSRRVSKLVFWSLGLESLRSRLGLKVFRSRSGAPRLETLHRLFFMRFCRKEFLFSFERALLLSTASPPRYRGRCWAVIRLSHRPEPSDRVVEGVGGLDSGGRHGRRFVLRQTHRPQRRPYPICTGRSRNVRHRCGGGWAGPRLFLLCGGHKWVPRFEAPCRCTRWTLWALSGAGVLATWHGVL